jgi:hypothetical protein
MLDCLHPCHPHYCCHHHWNHHIHRVRPIGRVWPVVLCHSLTAVHPEPAGLRSRGRGKRQEASGKRQEARGSEAAGKRQEARGKRQQARGKRQGIRDKRQEGRRATWKRGRRGRSRGFETLIILIDSTTLTLLCDCEHIAKVTHNLNNPLL